jgi:hypothetical protein
MVWHQFTWLWDATIGLGEGCRHEKFGYDGYGRVMIGNRCIISAHMPIDVSRIISEMHTIRKKMSQ